MESFKKLTTISYLPTFSILHFNKNMNVLYLPNQGTEMKLLGKWNSKWYSNESHLIGYLEQDVHKNIIFIMCAYYIENKEVSQEDFERLWTANYKHEQFLTPIHFIVSDKFMCKSVSTNAAEKPNIEKIVKPIKVIDEPIPVIKVPEVKLPEVKEESVNYTIYSVCKTDKPEVYHVYDKEQYISTCLIPNMKTSKYMSTLFDNKSLSDFIEMKLKYHEKSGKWIPIF